MLDINTALSLIIKGMEKTLERVKLTPVYPEDIKKGELPVVTDQGRSYVTFRGENSSVRREFSKDRIALLGTELSPEEAQDGDYTQITLCLLELNSSEESDVKYIAEDFSETLLKKYEKNQKFTGDKKLPQPVSKSAVKSGALSYDPNTLASRFTVIYPELRAAYKANIEKYGEFLPEDFFAHYGTGAVIETIKENNPKKMKRLFDLMNDIYDNGTNDVQSLIAVSILGSLENDQVLLANCVDYMDQELCTAVIHVNKYLAQSKSARLRLQNPPPYKPKRVKKRKSLSERLMGAGQPR